MTDSISLDTRLIFFEQEYIHFGEVWEKFEKSGPLYGDMRLT